MRKSLQYRIIAEVSNGLGSKILFESVYIHTLCMQTAMALKSLLLYSGVKNISILHLSCKRSDLQFSLILQTHAIVL